MTKTMPAALILGYARPAGVVRLVKESVAAGVQKIYVSIDGAVDSKVEELQFQLMQELEVLSDSLDVNIVIWRSSINRGSAGAVISALDRFFEIEACGFVLEDDLTTHPDFFNFCKQALLECREDERVWIVGGTQIFESQVSEFDFVWTHYPMIWGWATWAHKWKEIRRALLAPSLAKNNDTSWNTWSYWKLGKQRALRGHVDAWDLPLAGSMLVLQKLCLLPPKNLVSNLGVDSAATHTNQDEWPLSLTTSALNRIHTSNLLVQEMSPADYDLLLEKNLFKIGKFRLFKLIVATLVDFFREPIHSSLHQRIK